MADTNNLASMALRAFGADAQLVQTAEECSELAVAVLHYRRCKLDRAALAVEVADVEIMLEQMAAYLDIDDPAHMEKARREQRAKALRHVLRTNNRIAAGEPRS
jgi:NTP pyrophosphatase (non-canonical NTP hydrolase)